jgi:hypothetical protein
MYDKRIVCYSYYYVVFFTLLFLYPFFYCFSSHPFFSPITVVSIHISGILNICSDTSVCVNHLQREDNRRLCLQYHSFRTNFLSCLMQYFSDNKKRPSVRESKQHFSNGEFLGDFRQTTTLSSETGI